MINEKRAWQLLKKYIEDYKPEWKESMIEHAEIVHDLSVHIANILNKKENIDIETIRIGSILHDIGRTRAEKTIQHGIEGAKILEKENIDKRIIDIAKNHLGVGISKEDAADLDIPNKEYGPQTIEEKIICYADNLIFYEQDENKHIIKKTQDVIDKFKEEIGIDYAKKTRKFIDDFENKLTTREIKNIKRFIKNYNKLLKDES